MKKLISLCFAILGLIGFGQVGINTPNPVAALDIHSTGDTSSTKGLEVSNVDDTEILTVLDNGDVGINIGSSPPEALLHVNEDIKHENLPVLSPPYNRLGVDEVGKASSIVSSVEYFYFKRTSNFGFFTLSNTNTYTNIPFPNGTDVLGNSVGFGFGTDTSATINGQSVSNVSYLTIPKPGVYLFEMYQTVRCQTAPNTSTNTGLISFNIVFGSTLSGSTYTTNTIFRDNAIARRRDIGSVGGTHYDYANPTKLVVTYQTTQPNEKVALFINYASGDRYSDADCYMNQPLASDNYGYLIVTKL